MQQKIKFAAIDPFGIVSYKEPKEIKNRDEKVVSWGIKNDYPDYLLSLYNEVGTLRSVINGCIDYTRGNGIECPSHPEYVSTINKLLFDMWVYGGCAYQVIRNKIKETSRIVYLDIRKVRCNEDGTEFYYSEDWTKSLGRCKYITYPKFNPEDENQETGIVYVKRTFNQVYPTPMYGAKTTIQACEIEKEITSYHYNSIRNGFVGGYAFNFCNGEPEDEQKKEIEKDILEKYTGSGNAGRILINYSDDKDHGLVLTKLETEDFGKKYEELAKKSLQEIYSAFRASPALFGMPSEGLGFNTQEYDQMFKLFNRTVIKPVQSLIQHSFEELGIQVAFIPFTIEE